MIEFASDLKNITIEESDKFATFKFKTAAQNRLNKRVLIIFFEKGDAFFEKFEWEVDSYQVSQNFDNQKLYSRAA